MRLEYTRGARRDLDSIWDWNDTRYGPEHADKYVDLLEKEILTLVASYGDGKPIDSHSGLRRTTIRQRPRGHGHIVVYRTDEDAGVVSVLHIYHTAQDWRGRLDKEGPR